MKTRNVALTIMTVGILSLAFGYTYGVGYFYGSAEERLHWLVSYREGIWTAHENPAHPILPPGRVIFHRNTSFSVNSIPVAYSR